MKKFIILFLLIIFSISGNCQKRNANGKKVVNGIEIYLNGYAEPMLKITFKYNIKNELIWACGKETARKTVWNKKQGTLTRTQYDNNGNIDKNYHYSYTFGDNGFIKTMTQNCIGIDGSLLKKIYYYCYDDVSRLHEINQRWFYYDEKGKGRELSERYMQYYAWDGDGNIFSSISGGYQWKKEEKYDMDINWSYSVYDNIVNDTNIDFFYLTEYGRTELFEMATEWVNCHSKYLIKQNFSYFYEYDFDNLNNITKCRVYKGSPEDVGILLYTINLSY